jgi:hypothetical protein
MKVDFTRVNTLSYSLEGGKYTLSVIRTVKDQLLLSITETNSTRRVGNLAIDLFLLSQKEVQQEVEVFIEETLLTAPSTDAPMVLDEDADNKARLEALAREQRNQEIAIRNHEALGLSLDEVNRRRFDAGQRPLTLAQFVNARAATREGKIYHTAAGPDHPVELNPVAAFNPSSGQTGVESMPLTANVLDQSTGLLSSAEWHKLPAYNNIVIQDPDGWDRANFDVSWDEPITEDEFKRRLTLSTVWDRRQDPNRKVPRNGVKSPPKPRSDHEDRGWQPN